MKNKKRNTLCNLFLDYYSSKIKQIDTQGKIPYTIDVRPISLIWAFAPIKFLKKINIKIKTELTFNFDHSSSKHHPLDANLSSSFLVFQFSSFLHLSHVLSLPLLPLFFFSFSFSFIFLYLPHDRSSTGVHRQSHCRFHMPHCDVQQLPESLTGGARLHPCSDDGERPSQKSRHFWRFLAEPPTLTTVDPHRQQVEAPEAETFEA